MIFLLPFILGCNPIKGVREAREKANKEGRMILENIDGYVQKAEIAAQRTERACFGFLEELFQKGRSSEAESGTGIKKASK